MINSKIFAAQLIAPILALTVSTILGPVGCISAIRANADGLSATSDGDVDNRAKFTGTDTGIQDGGTLSSNMTKKSRAKQAGNDFEKILNPAYAQGVVSASVITTGCTSSDDFRVNHRVVDHHCKLLIVREMQDKCRAAPYLEEISIIWSESNCDDRQIEFDNPALDWTDNNVVMPLTE